MEWSVIFAPEFDLCFEAQNEGLQDIILAYTALLKAAGPALSRPQVDSLKGSKHINMNELRIQHKGAPWRILFAFDPVRQAVLLLGGKKAGDKHWYKKPFLWQKKSLMHI